MTPKYVNGGIGDLLLSLEDAVNEGAVSIFSHYPKASDVYTPFNIWINRFEKYDSLSDLNNLFIPGEPLEHKNYPKFTVPKCPIEKVGDKIIGIHVEGSSVSNEFWKQRGQPGKNMSGDFIISLLNDLKKKFNDYQFYLFCSPASKDYLCNVVYSNLFFSTKIIHCDNIWDSLSCVLHCDFVIGMDSCIKTMSALSSIPTITLVGDYQDEYRDVKFLNPYVNDGVMKLVKFKDINLVKTEEVISLINL